jgi:hypothetical protein
VPINAEITSSIPSILGGDPMLLGTVACIERVEVMDVSRDAAWE